MCVIFMLAIYSVTEKSVYCYTSVLILMYELSFKDDQVGVQEAGRGAAAVRGDERWRGAPPQKSAKARPAAPTPPTPPASSPAPARGRAVPGHISGGRPCPALLQSIPHAFRTRLAALCRQPAAAGILLPREPRLAARSPPRAWF